MSENAFTVETREVRATIRSVRGRGRRMAPWILIPRRPSLVPALLNQAPMRMTPLDAAGARTANRVADGV